MAAEQKLKGSESESTLTKLQLQNVGSITRTQAGIWIPIILVLITISGVYAMYSIDDIKSRDTILYAKFLAQLKDR